MKKPQRPDKETSLFFRFALLALALFIIAFILKVIFY